MRILVSILVLAFSSVLFAADPIIDLHFAAEALTGINQSSLTQGDKQKLAYAIEKVNFALVNLSKGYRETYETSDQVTNCETKTFQHGGLSANNANYFCSKASSPTFIDCEIRLSSEAGASGEDSGYYCLKNRSPEFASCVVTRVKNGGNSPANAVFACRDTSTDD